MAKIPSNDLSSLLLFKNIDFKQYLDIERDNIISSVKNDCFIDNIDESFIDEDGIINQDL